MDLYIESTLTCSDNGVLRYRARVMKTSAQRNVADEVLFESPARGAEGAAVRDATRFAAAYLKAAEHTPTRFNLDGSRVDAE